MTRRPLGQGRYGVRGRSVTLWIEGKRIVAQWREKGVRRQESWPDTRTNRRYARDWAEAFAEERARPPQARAPVTTEALWRSYAEAEFPHLRPRSQRLYTDYWRYWLVFVGPHTVAEDLGVQTVQEFRAALEKRGLGVATQRKAVDVVRLVYNWGKRTKHLAVNEVRDYVFKVAKDARPVPVPEYRSDEHGALCGALPLDRATTWRAGLALRLCGYTGTRVNAVVHLRWEDVSVDVPGEEAVTWRAPWDKMGVARVQPLRAPAAAALRTVRTLWHAEAAEGWVFPPATAKSRHPTYTAQAVIAAVHRAEREAGVPSILGRASHSLRRMHFNDVLSVEGDISAAMGAIGDRDFRVAAGYRRTRDDRLRDHYDRMDKGAE